jgi:hypothetical protein
MNFGRSPLSGRGGGEIETTSAQRVSFRLCIVFAFADPAAEAAPAPA